MIIHCDNCQKKYKIDPSKLKSNKIAFQCKSCGHKVSMTLAENHSDKDVQKPATPAVTPVTAPQPPALQAYNDDPYNATMTLDGSTFTDKGSMTVPETKPTPKRRFGLNAKMFMLFFVTPVCLVVAASAVYLWQLESLTGKISSDSYNIVENLSQERVNDTARMVANQCRLYLESHSGLSKDEFNLDVEFRSLALQTVGETGYTCIYEIPDNAGKSSLWVHPNEKLIGVDLPSTMKKAMGDKYQAWWAIYEGAYKGTQASGYYKWKEKDGSIRDKYMTCMPVKGTPYIVAATTYVDEINRDVQTLKATANQMTQKTRIIIFAVFGVTILLMGSIVLFYSGRLKANLTTLIEAAEKISVGELNTQIQVKSKDEISDLAETISRMQESIRLSIERLRRRR